MRTDDLCEGPQDCPAAKDFVCNECGEEWVTEEDVGVRCPECKSRKTTIQRCADCPINALAKVRADSDAGKLLELTLDLSETVKTFKIDWNEIPAEQGIGLKILKEEQDKHKLELADRDRRR